MDYSIFDYIKQLRQKKREVISIEEKIETIRKDYEEMTKPLFDSVQRRKNELCALSQVVVSIRLGDLLEELSWLSEVKVSDIYVEMETGISYYGKYDIFEMLEFVSNLNMKNCKSNNNEIELDLFGCDEDYMVTSKPVFEYFVFLPLDLNAIQADGTKLIEHCDTGYGYDIDGRVYTKIIINYDIGNIICNFNLGYIDRVSDEDWYPADLFTQAIINCANRSYNSRNQSVRIRKDNK